MNAYSEHLSNCIQEPLAFTAVRRTLGDTNRAEWPMTEMIEVVSTYVADQAISDLTALYQHNTTSSAEFSAALWPVLGYEPAPTRGGGTRK